MEQGLYKMTSLVIVSTCLILVRAQYYEPPEVPDHLQRPDPQDLDPHEYYPGYAPQQSHGPPAHGPVAHNHGPAAQSHGPPVPSGPQGGSQTHHSPPVSHQPNVPAQHLGQVAQAHDLANRLTQLPQQFLGQANQSPSNKHQPARPSLTDTIGTLADRFTQDILRLFHL